jgi:hypothetical protein
MRTVTSPIAVSSPTAGSPAASRATRPLMAVALVSLALQFLAGMVVNLYVRLPASHPGTAAPDYFIGVAQGDVWALAHSALALRAHVVLGLLLFLASLALIGLAIAARRRAWIVASVFGTIGIMAAGFNGASFLNYGHDFSSLLMSLGFAVAMFAYTLGLAASGAPGA